MTDPEDDGASVANLRARFEQLSSVKPAPSVPRPKPKSDTLSSSTKALATPSERNVQDVVRGASSTVAGKEEVENLIGTAPAQAPTAESQRIVPPESSSLASSKSVIAAADIAEADNSKSNDGLVLGGSDPTAQLRRSSTLVRPEPHLAQLDAALTIHQANVITPNTRDNTSLASKELRPSLNGSITSNHRKQPPPVPVSRKSARTATLIPQDDNVDSEVNTEAVTGSQASSVRNLASRFASSAPPTVQSSPSASPSLERSRSISVTRASSPESVTLSSASESLESPPPKIPPVIPPRPVLTAHQDSDRRLVPARSATSPPATVIDLPRALAVDGPRDRSVSDVVPALSKKKDMLPPPPRKLPPPHSGVPPLPVRSNSIARPTARHVSSPVVIPATPESEDVPYIPPPPPSRVIGQGERLAPRAPGFATPGGSGDDGGSSDDEDEDEKAWSKAQELPDATFANRRPPTLRNRKHVQPTSHIYSFAVRGTCVVTGGQHHLHVWHVSGGASQSISLPGEHRITALEFRSANIGGGDDQHIWAGTKDGHLFEIDLHGHRVVSARQNIHLSPVVGIFRLGQSMLSLEENGKMLIWGEADAGHPPQLAGPFKSQRVADKQTFFALVGRQFWTASGPATKQGSSALSMRCPQIRVYDPTGETAFSSLPRPLNTPESAGHVGAVTSSAIVPSQHDLVFLGHDNGWVSVWHQSTHAFSHIQRVSPYSITALAGVGKYLWAGFRNGFICVYDVSSEPWTVHKAWKAHKDPVQRLVVDPSSLWTDACLQVASLGSDMIVQLWDGLLRDDWIDAELSLRQRDFCTYRTIRTLCISWNIDASRPDDLKGTPDNVDFLRNALLSTESPDIISFGFQEMIDLEDKKLTAKSMLLGKKKTEAKFTDGISSSYRVWHDKLVQAVRLNMPPECPYTVVHVGDLIGLFSCIFVKSSESASLRDVAKIPVKTGMGGRYGNKGAILSRFVIDDTSLCFINCHLAAGQSHRRQRDRDLVDILEDKSSFAGLGSTSPGAYAPGGDGSTVFDHELCVLSGDLNYRIDAHRDAVVAAVTDGTYETLLPCDQLNKNLATNQTFRLKSFKEPPITFAPTYKYDPGTDEYDSSSKKRIPAWCDRILYRADRAEKVTPVPGAYRRWEVNVSDHRPISSSFDMQVKSILSAQRAQVWSEIEAAWFGVESHLLDDARSYYSGM